MDILEITGLEQPNILVDENGTGYLVESKIDNSVTFISVFYELISKLFILFFVFVGAGSIAFITISLSVYNDINEYNKLIESVGKREGEGGEEEEECEEEFLEKYLDEYDSLEERKMNETELDDFKNLYIAEKTPRGSVMMCYNNATGAFEYYSDLKDLPYSYLEVVGRSYVVKYLCKELLIDTKSEVEKAKKIKEKLESENTVKDEVEGAGVGIEDGVGDGGKNKFNVFARFKSYNADSKKVSKKSQKDDGVKDNASVLLLERSNHYVYKGKLADYEKEHNDEDSTEEFEHLDYNTFKNLSMDEKKNL